MEAKRVPNCINCGAPVKDDGTFCDDCGVTLLGPGFMATAKDTKLTDDATVSLSPEQGKSDSLIGYILENRYRLNKELGRGGMGTVYSATRLLIGDEVAVKILHPELVTDPQSAQRFRREAQASARLKHPNVVSVYDFGVNNDGLFYLVTELADGQSLRQLLREKRTLSATSVSEIISQVCAALDEAHSHQIIHRDIKPDNIIVSESATRWRVKLLDFGIAKLRDLGTENLTQTSHLMGTPHYMSPEQCLGEELDARSDIYSLGVVLYELLCGGVPFDSPISMAVVVQHVNQAPPSLRAINASIPAAVEAVVMRALAKQREARPQSGGALAKELLAAVLETGPFQHASPRHSAPTVPFVTGSSATDTPGYLPTMVMPATSRTQPSRDTKESHPRSLSMPLLFVAALLAIFTGGAFTYLMVRDDESGAQGSSKTTPVKAETRPPDTSTTPIPASKPPPLVSQDIPTNRPANAISFAVSQYSGVNVRAQPSRDSLLMTTIGKNQGVWVLEVSQNYETFTIKSEGRDVTDNWSRIELADNPSVRGWVFSGFLSKE